MSCWAKKRRVMRRYDATAHLYDMRYYEEQTAKIEAALKNIRMKSRSSVLDLGCGTGVLFQHVAHDAEEIVGLDISRNTLIRAKERAKNLSNVHLLWADADNMPFKSNTFNYVFAVTLLQNVPDPTRTLDEIKRVSQTDSVVVITGLKKCFSLESFEATLKASGLRLLTMIDEYNLKCYVAVCAKLLH